MLASKLSQLQNISIDLDLVETNIVIFSPKNFSAADFLFKCKENGLLLGTGKVGVIRAVTHMDVSFEDVEEANKIIERIINS